MTECVPHELFPIMPPSAMIVRCRLDSAKEVLALSGKACAHPRPWIGTSCARQISTPVTTSSRVLGITIPMGITRYTDASYAYIPQSAAEKRTSPWICCARSNSSVFDCNARVHDSYFANRGKLRAEIARAVSKDDDARHIPQLWPALAVTAIAGSVDVIGYLLLAHVFTSHMSGNTVTFAMHFGSGNSREAWRHFVPILAFFCGVVIGLVFLDILTHFRVVRSFGALALLEVALLLAFIAMAHPVREWMVAFPAAAMGMQNALLRRVGEHRVRTTYITGMLTNTAQGLVEFIQSVLAHSDKARKKFADFSLYGGIWCCFAAGGIIGAYLELRYGTLALLLPAIALTAISIRDAVSPLRFARKRS
jgi:uncharacterized membrane protein YoaK (UPF0700 family)